MNKMINWYGLPCLLTEKNREEVAAIFTNIGGELTICELPAAQLAQENALHDMQNAGGFDCLGKTMPLQDEFTLVLSLTERCNAACRYCFLDAQTCGETMNEQLLYDALRHAARKYGSRRINVAAFGGEPTAAPGLLRQMVSVAREMLKDNCRFSITTNGYFSDEICDFLMDNCFTVSLSMDGVPEVQRIQRPSRVGIDQLEKNVRRLAQSACEIKVRSTVTEFSVGRMLDSVKYLRSLGVRRVQFDPVTPGGRAEQASVYTRPPVAEVFVRNLIACIEYGAENGIDVICFPYMNMMTAPVVFCDGNVHNRLVVGATGVLSTCVEVQESKHALYDALGVGRYDPDTHSFVYEFEHRRPFCRGCSGLMRNPECSSCPYHFFCAGGCPTRNYRGSQSTEMISTYRCSIMKLIMPYILNAYYENTF